MALATFRDRVVLFGAVLTTASASAVVFRHELRGRTSIVLPGSPQAPLLVLSVLFGWPLVFSAALENAAFLSEPTRLPRPSVASASATICVSARRSSSSVIVRFVEGISDIHEQASAQVPSN